MSRLTVRDLTIERAGRVLVRQLSLDLQAGECWVVLGENGSG